MNESTALLSGETGVTICLRDLQLCAMMSITSGTLSSDVPIKKVVLPARKKLPVLAS